MVSRPLCQLAILESLNRFVASHFYQNNLFDFALMNETAFPETASTPREYSRAPRDEDAVLEKFRRLRGPADDLRYGEREPLRDHLVVSHLPLVEHCARNFVSSGEPLEDLIQEGTIGLIKAVDRFDPAQGVRFSTYSYHLISGEIRHYLRDLSKMIHEPGWHAQLRSQVVRATELLTQQLSRAPQSAEIAASLGVQPQIVAKVLESHATLSVSSLENETDDGAREEIAQLDQRENEAPLAQRVEDQMMLSQALPQLRELEERAVRLFFYREYSKTEVARELGISVNYAAYLIKRGVANLRAILEQDVPLEAAALPEFAGAAPVATRRRRPMTLGYLPKWIDAHLARVLATPNPGTATFALLLLRLPNWLPLLKTLDEAQRRTARHAVFAMAKSACRRADMLVELRAAGSDDLVFAVLLPGTGAQGERVGHRWLHVWKNAPLFPDDATPEKTLRESIEPSYSFAFYPDDGKSGADLSRALQK